MPERMMKALLSGVIFLAAMNIGIFIAKKFDAPKTASTDRYEASRLFALPYIPVNTSVSDFGVTNLMFEKNAHNTVLYGTLINHSDRVWDELVFEVEAFDKNSNRLHGHDDPVIFSVTQLKGDQMLSINDGYGVRLFGISAENISYINLRLICGDAAHGESHLLSCKDSDKTPKSLKYYRAIEE